MEYADLLGIGAWKLGGRWNRVGRRAVYTSLEIGTAALESLSHLPRTIQPVGYALMTIRVDFRKLHPLGENFQPLILPTLAIQPEEPAGATLQRAQAWWDKLPEEESMVKKFNFILHQSISDAVFDDTHFGGTWNILPGIVVLMVPSAITPVYNAVLFPDARHFQEIVAVEKVEPFEFHPSLFSPEKR